jgi:hypothetical protein
LLTVFNAKQDFETDFCDSILVWFLALEQRIENVGKQNADRALWQHLLI